MFPTFISILDIQSWWEVPSIAHFCSLFRTAFNLLDFDIEDLEEALLTDGTEETSWLQELIVRLLSGCLPNNEISTFNYQMFLRRLFRQKCQEYDLYNPFNTDIDFQLLPLRTKVDILHALCDFRLDAEDVLEQLKNLEADSLRVEPLGTDDNKSAYWYFYGTRLYREDFKNKSKKGKSIWQVICFTENDWFQLAKKFKESISKAEKQLYQTLNENFLPELPRLFREKERLARKRLLENQPRRTSSRLRKQETPIVAVEEEIKQKDKEDIERNKRQEEEDEKLRKKQELQNRRREAYERRSKLRDQSEDSQSDKSDGRYEMAGSKSREKKNRNRQRKISESSAGSKDISTRSSVNRNNGKTVGDVKTSASTTVGRQTNNSLASATGQIVIQPIANTHRKKLKTSQVFRQTDEDLQTGMYKILEHVKNHEDAWPFVDPVDEEYAPNYYSVIRKPMDLQRMEDRLDSGQYKTYSKFKSDFQLIVDNCRLYNGADNEYTEMVDNLVQVFERATERFLDQISSSDEEIAVEYPENDADGKVNPKRRKITTTTTTTTNSPKRKATLIAQTDKKQSESIKENVKDDEKEEEVTHEHKHKPNKKEVPNKNENKKQLKNIKKPKLKKADKKENINIKKKNNQKNVKTKSKKRTPSRSRSRSQSIRRSIDRWSSSSPPPSWPPSSPESDIFATKKNDEKKTYQAEEGPEKITKKKQKKGDKWGDIFQSDCDKFTKGTDLLPKNKDKHNKLRETIEKLKAKSEISDGLNNKEGDVEMEKTKENRDNKKNKKAKMNKEEKTNHKDYDDDDVNGDGTKVKNKNKNTNLDDLTLATEQTLKDINKWLDDTSSKFCDDSPTSNSPSHYSAMEESDSLLDKKKNDKLIPKPRNDTAIVHKEVHKKRNVISNRDPTKYFKRREIQRTIDRLQPGKSKGNLLSNVQTNNKPEDNMFPLLGPLSKIKDSKNSLIVKTDDNAPKLSLGSVLDSFGKHKFVDDQKKEDNGGKDTEEKPDIKQDEALGTTKIEEKPIKDEDKSNVKTDNVALEEKKSCSPGKATPNLSAWFKAFGVTKVQPPPKKTEKSTESRTAPTEDVKEKEERKVLAPETSPNPDNPLIHGQTMPRQRKISTGSSVSERSSFSQDMDSPRVGIEERLGAYPAPYPSPLHRSPSGASPIMASPRPDVSPKAATYPSFNGQIRVGFYQDTVSTKSSPDKSCSPRDNPQSPYPQYSEHVYTPQSTQPYSYSNYYPQTPNYSSTNPTPPYNTSEPYYDTNKPLTDQYQAKTNLDSGYGHQTTIIPPGNQLQSQQNEPNKDKHQMFPMKKRVYSSDIRYDSEQDYNRNADQMQENALPNVTQITPQNLAVPTQNLPNQNVVASQNLSSNQNVNSAQNLATTQNLAPTQNLVSTQNLSATQNLVSTQNLAATQNLVTTQNLAATHNITATQNLATTRNLVSPQNLTTSQATIQSQTGIHMSVQPNQMQQHQQQQPQQQMQPSPVNNQPKYSNNNNTMTETRQTQELEQNDVRNLNYTNPNAYNYNYGLNVPNAGVGRPLEHDKYNNAGYSSDIPYIESTQQQYNRQEVNYSRSNVNTNEPTMPMRYADGNLINMGYKDVNINTQNSPHMGHMTPNTNIQQLSPRDTAVEYKNATEYKNPVVENRLDYPKMSIDNRLDYKNQLENRMDYKNPVESRLEYKNPVDNRLEYKPPVDNRLEYKPPVDNRLEYKPPVDNRLEYKPPVDNRLEYKPPVDNRLEYKPPVDNRLEYKNPADNVNRMENIEYKPAANVNRLEMSIPRPPYSTSSSIDMANLSNLSHIVDRYPSDDRILPPSPYYSDKNLMFTKSMATSTTGIPMFSQPNVAMAYTHEMQPTSSMYNRPMEMQNTNIEKVPMQQPPPVAEKKSKRRKTAKNSTPPISALESSVAPSSSSASSVSVSNQQGFQTYVGLKGTSQMEPSAISLKTASVVPGSAFNFGPTPTGLGLSTSGLYGSSDKDAYHPNFLDELRSAPNYYMAAAAAAAQRHTRPTPENNDKQSRNTTQAHQQNTSQPPGSYPFIGAPQPRPPPSYPLGGHFMPPPPHQAPPLMDTSSPLYRQYLQAGMLQQGLLGPPGTYPPGYHLSIRQQYDTMTRPPWL